MTTIKQITLPPGWSHLHDHFNEAPFAERVSLAKRWLSMGHPQLAWQIVSGKVTAAVLSGSLVSTLAVDSDGEVNPV